MATQTLTFLFTDIEGSTAMLLRLGDAYAQVLALALGNQTLCPCFCRRNAARIACIALLAWQGMRATTNGGHHAVERAVKAQFGEGFRPFALGGT